MNTMTMTHRPFVYIAGPFALGILLDHFVQISFGYICLGVVMFLILAAWFSKRELLATFFLLFAITVLAMAYTQSREYTRGDHILHVAKYYRKNPITVKGVIVSDVQKREVAGRSKTTFTLSTHKVKAPWGWKKRSGKILVNMFNDLDMAYGDDLLIEGRLHRPFNFSTDKNFSYRDYLSRRGIRFILSAKKDSRVEICERNKGNYFMALSLRLRNVLKGILADHLSKNEAGIMRAILLGDRTGIPKSIRMLFVQTGTAHILAISGLHIGIVGTFFLIFAKVLPFGRRGQYGIVICLLTGYAFLTGGRPSVIRATIMMVVFLTSFIVERELDALNTLCLAAVIILGINPLNLFDVGFQLSFVCVFSIIYLNLRRDRTGHHGDQWVFALRQSFTISLAIWIGVAGLIVYYFGIITPITVLANLVVVPLISIIVGLGFGLLCIGFILPSWGFVFAAALKLALNCLAGFVYLCDKIPFAHIYVREASLWPVILYYTALSVAIFIHRGKFDKSPRV